MLIESMKAQTTTINLVLEGCFPFKQKKVLSIETKLRLKVEKPF